MKLSQFLAHNTTLYQEWLCYKRIIFQHSFNSMNICLHQATEFDTIKLRYSTWYIASVNKQKQKIRPRTKRKRRNTSIIAKKPTWEKKCIIIGFVKVVLLAAASPSPKRHIITRVHSQQWMTDSLSLSLLPCHTLPTLSQLIV